jgi:signal peptidase I
MQPTLKADEYMVVLKPFYTPARGDIVVLQLPTATVPYIKRVIGLPGDVITLQGGKLYINGTPLAEPYVNNGLEGQDGQWGPIPAGAYFVMGDNRDNSSDSRVFGAVPRNEITGRVFLEVTPNIRMVP